MIEKRDILKDGVWCLADIGTSEYEILGEQSQKEVVWADQAKYGHYIIYFCVVIIFVFMIKRLIYYQTDRSSILSEKSSNYSKSWYYKIAAINRWVAYRRIPKFMCNLFQLPSSMGNFVVIMTGILFILLCSFIPRVWYRACAGFGSPPLAVRAGMESISLIPIIIILSGKTNLISQVTGISYEKINVYHRWVSFMCCLLAWVHAVAFWYQAGKEGGSKNLAYNLATDNMWVNGIPPLVFITILTIFSHSYIRGVWYELWLKTHWICAIGLYVSLFFHAYNTMDANNYMIAAIVFWVVQLLWRGLMKSMLKPNKGFLRANKCKMKRFISNSRTEHFFEVIIENTNDFSWVPGQHIFLRIPGLRCLESHPFSIVSRFVPNEDTDIKLVIKAASWGGLTSHIYNQLPDTGYTESNVFVDGPYGGSERAVEAFDNVYLLASGTGITAIIPFLTDIADKISKNEGIVNFVSLNWIVKSSQNIEWIVHELENVLNDHSSLINRNQLAINIHVKDGMSFEYNELLKSSLFFHSDTDSDEKSKSHNDGGINIINEQYPDVKEIMLSTKETLGKRNMYIVSGSDSMKTAVSDSVASFQTEVFTNKNVKEIYLHSENFGW